MKKRAQPFATLDPEALSAFVSGMGHLPANEISKLKRLYLLNAVTDFESYRATMKSMLITVGILSIIPIFLLVFIPVLISYRQTVRASRQKILNAVEIWKGDLGDDAVQIFTRLNA
jgi:hypothetical protein